MFPWQILYDNDYMQDIQKENEIYVSNDWYTDTSYTFCFLLVNFVVAYFSWKLVYDY